MVGPAETLNMDEVRAFALSNPITFVHPTATPLAVLAGTWSTVSHLERALSLRLHQISS